MMLICFSCLGTSQVTFLVSDLLTSLAGLLVVELVLVLLGRADGPVLLLVEGTRLFGVSSSPAAVITSNLQTWSKFNRKSMPRLPPSIISPTIKVAWQGSQGKNVRSK